MSVGDRGARLTLQASARTNGGHTFNCLQCVFGTCVGIYGPEDTVGSAHAVASGSILIRVPDAVRTDYYRLRVTTVTTARPEELRVAATDGRGLPIPAESGIDGTFIVAAVPGSVFTVMATLDLKSSAKGNSADDHNGSATITALLEPMGQADAKAKLGHRIAGGSPAIGFPAVGALTFDGSNHCSGVLIGPHTILTAAHCLFNPERPITKMRFWLGPSVQEYTMVAELTGKAIPSGEDGFRYVDSNQPSDDIALAFFDTWQSASGNPQAPNPMKTQTKADALTRCLSIAGCRVVLVGSGITDPDVRAEWGVKMKVPMALKALGGRTFEAHGDRMDGCAGDSGGPVFIDGSALVVGVTSYGALDCSGFAASTRVDAFQKWLKPRIK